MAAPDAKRHEFRGVGETLLTRRGAPERLKGCALPMRRWRGGRLREVAGSTPEDRWQPVRAA
ncbi:MAG: hypothetical protein AAFZ09_11015, partial [Pseudomonadota bacterium]